MRKRLTNFLSLWDVVNAQAFHMANSRSRFQSPPSLKGFGQSGKKSLFTNPVTTLLMGFIFSLLVLALIQARKEMKMESLQEETKDPAFAHVSDRPDIAPPRELPPDPDVLFAKEKPVLSTPTLVLEMPEEEKKELKPIEMEIDTSLSSTTLRSDFENNATPGQ